MFRDYKEAVAFMEENGVRYVDFKFTDLIGRWHHLSVPVESFSRSMVERGIGVDGSSISRFRSVDAGDLNIVPDLSAAFVDPFWQEDTVSFICNLVEADTGEPFEADPRGIARKAQEVLASSGVADESRWGPEFEFYLFDEVRWEVLEHRSMFAVDSAEGFWNKGGSEEHVGLGLHLGRKNGYHAIRPFDTHADLRAEMVRCIQEYASIPVKYHHHEVGGPAQQEIEIMFLPLMEAADAVMIVKYMIRCVAAVNSCSATFMPKPLAELAGNGLHLHLKLFKEGKPVFFDPEGEYANLSDTALSFMAGILHHGPSLCAFTNASTNSYKRLVPGFEAPVNLFFSLANRSAAIRIPKYAVEPAEKRFEYRPPDATANPYLAMAAILMAGLDGVEKGMDPRKMGMGPFTGDISTPERAAELGIRSLPASLREALEALERDHEYLLRGGVFSERMIERWISYKTETEVGPVERTPVPMEYELYYSC